MVHGQKNIKLNPKKNKKLSVDFVSFEQKKKILHFQ